MRNHVTVDSIPEPHDVVALTMTDGAVIRVRRHGNPAGPRLVLGHGNGFAIDGYFPFWRLLLEDFDVVVHDQRNHGQNPRHDEPGHSIAQMARDVAGIQSGIASALGPKPTAGVFHSVSAVAGILANICHGVVWDALVLIDPALVPPPDHPEHEPARRFEQVLAQWARNRQDRFGSPAELAAQLRAARAGRSWRPEAATYMANAITRRTAAGEFELACPRALEARIYEQNVDAGTWTHLCGLRGPVGFVGADPALSNATPPARIGRLAAQAFGLRHRIVPETGHMMQIERPEACIAVTRAFLAEFGFL